MQPHAGKVEQILLDPTGTEAYNEAERLEIRGVPGVNPIPESPIVQTPVPIATYTDPVIGHAVDYPSGWQVIEQPGAIVSLTSFTASPVAKGGLQPSQARIELVPEPPERHLEFLLKMGLTAHLCYDIIFV